MPVLTVPAGASPLERLGYLHPHTAHRLRERFAECPLRRTTAHAGLDQIATDLLSKLAREPHRLPVHVWPDGRPPRP